MSARTAAAVVRELCPAVDGLGPEAVVLLRDARRDVAAVVVIDNTACGPAIGGVRMALDVTVDEVARLARAMTLKNAAARLPHGGGKAGIVADPLMPATDKEHVIRWFAGAIRDLHAYTPGPDMGTDERCMAWILDEIGRSVGLPAVMGGIPLDELGATGFGLAIAAEAVDSAGVLALRGARVAIQGFGAVGTHAARFLVARGASVVAVSDSRGAVRNPVGLAVEDLVAWKRSGHAVSEFSAGEATSRGAVLSADCDILIPAARPDVLTATNVDDVKAKVVLQGANIPATPEAEARLEARGVLCLPDWIVNAGGVICASVEDAGGTRQQAFEEIEERIRANTAAVIERSRAGSITPRAAAEEIALAAVTSAQSYRRSF